MNKELKKFLSDIKKNGEMDAIILDKKIIDNGDRLRREYMLYSPSLKRHIWLREEHADHCLYRQIEVYEYSNTRTTEFYSENKSPALQIILMQKEANEYFTQGQYDARELNRKQQSSLYKKQRFE
jgi:hypothetical protein